MKKVILALIVTLLLTNGSVVWAEIFPALELERNGTGYALASNRTYGWEFSATEDIAVVGLGIFDLFDDGLYLSHEIGIWHSGELVLSTTIPSGTEGVLIDQFRYIETDPFWLTEGETYVIGACGLGDPYVGNDGSARITTTSSITYERTLFSPSGSGFTLPTLVQDEFYLFGPNFLVIPEPMTVFLFGLGGILIARKR
jgi:hypothetical protein